VARGEDEATLATEVFAHRVAAAVSAMACSAGGIDALVFTAGIGDGSAATRERVCERLAFLGLHLDPDRNSLAEGDRDIATDLSAVRALVVRAREELIAARAARELLGVGRRGEAAT
jgi:acetate kinase